MVKAKTSKIKIGVAGLWHLGCVTAACLAEKGFQVAVWDPDPAVMKGIALGKAPLFEPGLDDLLAKGFKSGRLRIASSSYEVAHQADFIWVTFDTPVDENDNADIEWVKRHVADLVQHRKKGAGLIIASQVPAGTCAAIESAIQKNGRGTPIPVCYTPENLRLGKAIKIFQEPDRIVIGIRRPRDKRFFEGVFSAITTRLEWMKTESAEMTKHAINSFLAASVVFVNELASLCEAVGADAREVERGLKTEERVGPKAYLKPGSAFAGGTLARDVRFIISLGESNNHSVLLMKAILKSNSLHKNWAQEKLLEYLKTIKGRRVTILGLTYKAGTDTLRRSWAVELAKWLHNKGAEVRAFDWQLQKLPSELAQIISLKDKHSTALKDSDALVVGTDHPGLKSLVPSELKQMRHCLVVDPNGTLNTPLLDSINPIDYCSVGYILNRQKS